MTKSNVFTEAATKSNETLDKMVATLVKSLASIEDLDGSYLNPTTLEYYVKCTLGLATKQIDANPIMNQQRLSTAMSRLSSTIQSEFAERESIHDELLSDLRLLNNS